MNKACILFGRLRPSLNAFDLGHHGQDTVPDLLKGRNNLGWWDVKAIPTQLWGVTVLDAGTPVCVVTSCAGGRICNRMALLHL